MADFKNPRVGVGVFIMKKGDTNDPVFIMGQRQGSTGSGTWALPGGHLEFGESFEDCSAREIMEETGLAITNIRYLTATNDIMAADKRHYITIFMVCERETDDEPQILEPNKCLQWKWVRWSEMEGWAREEQNVSSSNHADSTTTVSAPMHRLFTPMMALLQQRAGVLPALS